MCVHVCMCIYVDRGVGMVYIIMHSFLFNQCSSRITVCACWPAISQRCTVWYVSVQHWEFEICFDLYSLRTSAPSLQHA